MRMTELWLAPAGTEFMVKDADGVLQCASEDGVEPAIDLTGFIVLDPDGQWEAGR